MSDDVIDWQTACADQTDLLKRALGRERKLAERLKAHDDAHRSETARLREENAILLHQRDEARAGAYAAQDAVPRAVYEETHARLVKASDKLKATRIYAEQQRRAHMAKVA